MERSHNPYSPGAGTRPPELAGRESVLEETRIALGRVRSGYAEKSMLLVGLRGVGKTVLLRRISLDAERDGLVTVFVETPEDRTLMNSIIAPLRSAFIQMSRREAAKVVVERAMRVLGSFIQSAKLEYGGAALSVEMGVADSGDLQNDLGELLRAAGEAAKAQETALVLCLDELQYAGEAELGALLAALHRCTQYELPVLLVGAGLPQLVERSGKAKSYAERMLSFLKIGALDDEAARRAIHEPAKKLNVLIHEDALDAIVEHTCAYPYFLQEWGKHCWNCAPVSPITLRDVEEASEIAQAELDASFFRVRLERLTRAERRYLHAMAEVPGPDPRRSGAIAQQLGVKVESVSPTRSSLIRKGMIYSPAHGDTSFTVPLFDDYLRRVTLPD